MPPCVAPSGKGQMSLQHSGCDCIGLEGQVTLWGHVRPASTRVRAPGNRVVCTGMGTRLDLADLEFAPANRSRGSLDWRAPGAGSSSAYSKAGCALRLTPMRRYQTTCWPASKGADASLARHAHFPVGSCRKPIAQTGDPSFHRVGRRGLCVGSVHLGGRHQGSARQDRDGPGELVAAIGASGFTELPIRASHAAGVSQLAMHHNARSTGCWWRKRLPSHSNF